MTPDARPCFTGSMTNTEILQAADGRMLVREMCDHDEPTTTRVAHGFLGDLPAGTIQTLCSGCGMDVNDIAVIRAIHLQKAEDLAFAQGVAHQADQCLWPWSACALCEAEEAYYDRQMEGDPF